MRPIQLVLLSIILFLTFTFLVAKSVYSAGTQIQGFYTDGTVHTLVRLGDTIYIGGDYSQIQVSSGTAQQRTNLAAYDLSTNTFINWSPQVEGIVRAIAVDQNYIYIGGEFTYVNNQPRDNFAVIEINTGNLVDWQLDTNGPILALAIDGDELYLGGAFTSINGQERSHIAVVNTNSRTVLEWNPDIEGTVYAIAIDNIIIYIGGDFKTVNGQARNNIASFTKSDKQLTSLSPTINEPVKSIVIDGTTVFFSREPVVVNNNQMVYIARYDSTNSTVTYYEDITVTPTIIPQGGGPPEDGQTSQTGEVEGIMVNEDELGFEVPTLADVLTFTIRGFFTVAGLVALFYLLLGAFSWITSGGDKDAVSSARGKIQAAVVGVIMIVATLAIVVTLEQVVFDQRICFGISCPATIPQLLEPA